MRCHRIYTEISVYANVIRVHRGVMIVHQGTQIEFAPTSGPNKLSPFTWMLLSELCFALVPAVEIKLLRYCKSLTSFIVRIFLDSLDVDGLRLQTLCERIKEWLEFSYSFERTNSLLPL